MRISKLSKYTFKVILTKEDIQRLNVNAGYLSRGDDSTKLLISRLVDIIERSLGIKISKTKLFVEVFEDENDGCIVYLCGSEELAPSDDNITEAVFSLSFDKLFDLSKKLLKTGEEYSSSLYYDNGYRLIVTFKKSPSDLPMAISRLIKKYGASYRTVDILFTKEHFSPLCENGAVEKILSAT